MLNRNEAVLRELNLYPLWGRRAGVLPHTPSPLVEEAREEGEIEPATLSPALPPQGGGSQYLVGERAAAVKTSDIPPLSSPNLDWSELALTVQACTACKLRAGCTQTVFGVGDVRAKWLFVGEGPGADEDAQGEPFVGQAGKLLDNMLAAMGLQRGRDVYIANIVKCRPPANRTPEADEIAQCLPYLQRQIEFLQPKLIVALGKTAATALLGREATLGSLRGAPHQYQGIPLVVTYHPAYLLRTPSDKAKSWQDLRLAMQSMAGLAE